MRSHSGLYNCLASALQITGAGVSQEPGDIATSRRWMPPFLSRAVSRKFDVRAERHTLLRNYEAHWSHVGPWRSKLLFRDSGPGKTLPCEHWQFRRNPYYLRTPSFQDITCGQPQLALRRWMRSLLEVLAYSKWQNELALYTGQRQGLLLAVRVYQETVQKYLSLKESKLDY